MVFVDVDCREQCTSAPHLRTWLGLSLWEAEMVVDTDAVPLAVVDTDGDDVGLGVLRALPVDEELRDPDELGVNDCDCVHEEVGETEAVRVIEAVCDSV